MASHVSPASARIRWNIDSNDSGIHTNLESSPQPLWDHRPAAQVYEVESAVDQCKQCNDPSSLKVNKQKKLITHKTD